jgi:hypothetical protein
MNKDVLATMVRHYETESLFDVVPFNRTETFLCRSRSWPWRDPVTASYSPASGRLPQG